MSWKQALTGGRASRDITHPLAVVKYHGSESVTAPFMMRPLINGGRERASSGPFQSVSVVLLVAAACRVWRPPARYSDCSVQTAAEQNEGPEGRPPRWMRLIPSAVAVIVGDAMHPFSARRHRRHSVVPGAQRLCER